MRQVLVEAARRRNADKRGGPGVVFVTWDDSIAGGVTSSDDVIALDNALESLAKLQPRQAEMVVCRFFGGLDVTETAALLDVSEATILRDWRAAKAWLAKEIKGRARRAVNSERWERIQSLFHDAVDLPSGEHDAFLQAVRR